MQSMTGYGSSLHKDRDIELEIHVKSVNGRFLEVRFHLPKEYAPHENDFRRSLSAFKRGTIDVYVHRRPAPTSKIETAKIRPEMAKHWATELKGLAKSLKLDPSIRLRDLLQMPFVMEHQDRVRLFPGELKLFEKQLRSAVEHCQKLRAKEGVMLKKELALQLKNLTSTIKSMESWRDEALKATDARLKSRLEALQVEGLDPTRLALETALLIDKMDVREEMVRLKEHVKACLELLNKGEASGKKLDFYCQELLREVNTIGSKSQLASLTQVVVEAKSVIEKFREQVQNIE